MQRNVKGSMPIRRKQLQYTFGIPEPTRKSMYDTLMENLKRANRATFLHRIVYIGRHNFVIRNDEIVDVFSKIMTTVNESYCIEPLTGFLLYYRKHFIHVVEGDEDSINRHLELLLRDEDYENNFATIKLLIHVSHIGKRIIPFWTFYYGKPAKLVGKIHMNNLHEWGRIAYTCLKRIYKLVDRFARLSCGSGEGEIDESASISTRSLVEQDGYLIRADRSSKMSKVSRMYDSSVIRLSEVSAQLAAFDPFRGALPEEKILEKLLDSDFTLPLTSFHKVYGVVPQRDIYKDRVWPVPSDFIPYSVFEGPYDACVNLHDEGHYLREPVFELFENVLPEVKSELPK